MRDFLEWGGSSGGRRVLAACAQVVGAGLAVVVLWSLSWQAGVGGLSVLLTAWGVFASVGDS